MMFVRFLLLLLVSMLLYGCMAKPLPPIVVELPAHQVDYQKEIKPILDKRCTVCHSCYNSPCQLKLDSFEGLDRGSSKQAVYNGTRLHSMDPTRLFVDAKNSDEWRKKGFSTVTGSTVGGNLNDSIMLQMLAHKIKNPKSSGDYRPEADDLTCAKDQNELGSYLEKHPNRGMPFGFPPLKQDEFNLIAGWLAQGGKGPTAEQQAALMAVKPADVEIITAWERFLNSTDPKHAMTARYLYEHLFLAHLDPGTKSGDFYELVRSRTPAGQAIEIIPTVRPYDDPGLQQFYYRLRKIHSTIVNKTHLVFPMDLKQLERTNDLFIKPDWLQPPHIKGYEPENSANPFVTFEQIPPRSRYQFLLDNSRYIIMTFIHGPVCKGQIALNVIDDHFWVMFLDPDHDLSVNYPGFMKLHYDKLRMPIERGSDMGIFSAVTDRYSKGAAEFYRLRQDFYAMHHYGGTDFNSIWKGNKASDAPLLTIYRHFDSASVHRGALGNLPKTLWVIDYPLLERIYYALVAGFDVYGNIGHQLAIRLYMDRLRVEGESYFLDFLPAEQRQQYMQSWNMGVNLEKLGYYPSPRSASGRFVSQDTKREFVEGIIDRHLLPAVGVGYDPVNYLHAGEQYPMLPAGYSTISDYLRGFRSLGRPGTPFISMINDHNSNIGYLRIRTEDGNDPAITIVINRWHDNVAFLFGEDKRLDRSKDDADFISGLIGSYPNYFFDVAVKDLPDFMNLVGRFSNSAEDHKRLAKYGINRADERFWELYDWFQQRFDRDNQVEGGLLDLNRYFYRAE